MTNHDRQKVYRVQGLPDHPGFDRLAAARLVASAISDPSVTADDIHIYSLATSVEPHKRWNRKVATVMFRHTPSDLVAATGANNSVVSEWRLPVLGEIEPLVLDSHFLGLTVLNDVSVAEHRFDCIALSGLASHPFGSWQPKGDDKSYMWIRDTLPTNIDGVRFILYGYDTTLKNSHSFQTIVDLANTLYLTLQTHGWASPSTKPLIFLAHSLGGVLLKQLIVILAGANEKAQFMLTMIRGAMLFGTPSHGMALGQLLAMVGDQPNRDLVKHLSETSRSLPDLEIQFSGISESQRMRLYWAYETKTSPTVQEIDGLYERSGPRCIMVNQQSATGNRTLDPSFTIQIDEDHSDMVKFNRGDRRIPIIISKIQEICISGKPTDEMDTSLPPRSMISDPYNDSDTSYRGPDLLEDTRNSGLVDWDYDLIVSLLKATEVDQRQEQIDRNFGHTFSWAFENSKIGLKDWLRKGEGIFWINGKPGSGKSTFVKFLLNDSRTTELLHHWQPKPGQITANFFFHHRGTRLQKSLKGLLKSLLSQLLSSDPRLHQILGGPQSEKAGYPYETIQSDVYSFFQRCNIDSSTTTHQKRMVGLLAENPSLRLHHILEEEAQHMSPDDRFYIKQTLLRDFARLRKSARIEENALLEEGASGDEDVSVGEDTQEETDPLEREKGIICQKLLLKFPKQEEPIRTILKRWFESMDISSRIWKLLEEAQLNVLEPDNERHLTELLERQKVRLIRLINNQLMWWTRENLEKGFRQIMNQDTFDLKVCLFFDALDEYDGRPEVIADFLRNLVEAKPKSKTRIRILFSSRPWPVFHEHFDSWPSISIHEHTMKDIQEYCAGFIPQLSRTRIHPFVDEIANRAKGVFVWVKLVMADLAAIVATDVETDKQLSQRLRQCLASIPDELEDYYSTIIQRLPWSTRTESYILLECLSRSSVTISLDEVPSLLACGMSDSLHEAQTSIKGESAPNFKDLWGDVRTISGGLVDLVPHDFISLRQKAKHSPVSNCGLQLMHQTVKDWIVSGKFKGNFLNTRATMIWQNGHSFLVKYYIHLLASGEAKSLGNEIFDHAEKAEKTTGFSQYNYLSLLPITTLSNIINDAKSSTDEVITTPTLAIDATKERKLKQSLQEKRIEAHGQWPIGSASYGLQLAAISGLSCYVKDFIEKEPHKIQQSVGPLLSISLGEVRYKSAVYHREMLIGRFEWMKLILDNGFRIQSDPAALSLIFEGIWTSMDQQTADMYMDLVMAAVRNGLPVENLFDISLDPGSPTSLLHISPPRLAEFLLGNSADPNKFNRVGKTSLDYILESESVFQRCVLGLDWLYDVVRLLIKNGAKQRKGTKHRQRLQVHKLLQRLGDNGYDIGPLLSLREGSLGLGEENASLFTRVFGGSRGR